MALARTNNKEAVMKILRREIDKLEQKIEMVRVKSVFFLFSRKTSFFAQYFYEVCKFSLLKVSKMIKLSQLPSVSNVPSHQLDDWEDEFELLHIQSYMTKCYSAVLKGQDCPSCKVR